MGSRKIPDDAFILIIGAMKCGTSTLYNYLVESPSICPCTVKEPEYFSTNQGHKYTIENYEDLWAFNPSLHRYVLEASTGYTKYPTETDIPETMYKYGIRPKLIYIVRNPFDRMISHYNHLRYKYNFGSRKQSLLEEELLYVSKYFTQLEQYRDFFPKEQILILDFDELKNNPRATLTDVFSFLDVALPDVISSDQIALQKNKTILLSRFELFLKRKPLFRRVYSKLPQGVGIFGEKVLPKYFTPEKQIMFDDQEKNIIYDRLGTDMKKLHDEYGVNIMRWGF